jgi:hypothetical protein
MWRLRVVECEALAENGNFVNGLVVYFFRLIVSYKL